MASKLPVTVTAVSYTAAGLWAVTVAYGDGTTGLYLIPSSLVTAEAVSLSALAMAVASEVATATWGLRSPTTGTYTLEA